MSDLRIRLLRRRALTAITSFALAATVFGTAPAPVRAAGDTAQDITFEVVENTLLSAGLVELMVSSSSGLAVSVEAVDSDGVCSVTGHEVTLLALGDCHLHATQPGNDTYAAAEPVDRSFVIIEDTNDEITAFSLNGNTDMQYGVNYDAIPGKYHSNYFTIDWEVDGDGIPTIDSLTPSVCEVDDSEEHDGTVGYFLGAGECQMLASLYEGEDDDVLATIRIERGDATLVVDEEATYGPTDSDYDTEISRYFHALDMFDRPRFPIYVRGQGNLPEYHMDGSAGFEFGERRECRNQQDADVDTDPTMPMVHAGTCFVMVHTYKQPNWMKSEAVQATVHISKMERDFTDVDFGISDGYGSDVATTQKVGFIGDPYFIEADYEKNHWDDDIDDTVGIIWTKVAGDCNFDVADGTVGVLTYGNTGNTNGDQCRVKLELPATQDYVATPARYFDMKFMKEPGKIVFPKLPTFTLIPRGGEAEHPNVFDINAYVKSLSGGATHMAVSHRPALHFDGPCSRRSTGESTTADNPHGGIVDRTSGYIGGITGYCTVTAKVHNGYGVSAQRVSRTFQIVKSSNTITFPIIANHGAGDTLIEGEDFTVSSTWFETTLEDFSAACAVSHNSETDLWEIDLLTPGLCKITATNPASPRVKAATPVTRIFTVTKATGHIVLGVDLNNNDHFGDMYLSDDDCFGIHSRLCYEGDHLAVKYNSVGNRVYDLESVDNSDGTVTYSKTSGECTVSNVAKTVTITGRNSGGTCVVRASLAASAEKTSAFDEFVIGVVRADGTIGFWTTPGPLTLGTNVTLNGASEAGTVVYSVADATKCTVAGAVLHPVAEGTCTVYADVPESDRFFAAAQREYEVSVSKATQTITFTTAAERTYPSGSNSITVNPTSTSGLTVSVTLDGESTGCTSGGAGGKTITFTGVGSCILVASQAGNGTYSAADDVTRTIVISKKPVAVVAPTITMPVTRQGQTATRTQGDWTGSGGVLTYSTAWYRCSASSVATPTTASVTGCTAVGATGATYVATNTDVNKYLRVRITVTNYSGTSYRWSTTTAKILTP